MVRAVPARRWLIAGGMTGAVLVASGCAARVTRKDFDAEMVKIREEMQSSDGQLGTRIDSVSQLAADHQRRLDALEQELQTLRQEYNVSIERMEGMLKFNVPVHFEFDRAELRESDRPVLDRFAAVAREHYPDAVITVEGFADPAGSAAYNRRLGRRRAEAVREHLASAGQLAPDRLKVVSYGEARERQIVPGARGPGDEGLPNRRVALVIDYAGGAGETVATP
ncbi:MAG TPA: OmpA family protein [Gemmatimonadales bacterium]|nr:OmpA family protein [Gemmatimonadales bacterium]